MTTIQMELWQLLVMAGCCTGAAIGAFWALALLIIKQAQRTITEKFSTISEHLNEQDGKLQALNGQLADLRVEIARDYVRRDDYIRDIGSLGTQFQALAINVERLFRDAQRDTMNMIKSELARK